jgi:hypothetical protein
MNFPLALILFLSVSIVTAEDFRTLRNQVFADATVSRAEPDGLVLITKTGIVKVYFSELPKEIQERYHYEAAQAASFAQQNTERQRALQEKIQADQRAKTEQAQAAARAQAQSKATTTTKVIPQNSGMILRPEAVDAAWVIEHPFSLRGYIFEMTGVRRYEKQEVKAGVYEVEMWADNGCLVAELTAAQVNSIGEAGTMFVRVKAREKYSNKIAIEVVGSGVMHQGFSQVPTFYWK